MRQHSNTSRKFVVAALMTFIGMVTMTVLVVRPSYIFAQTTTEDAVAARRAQLEADLQKIEGEIDAQKNILAAKQQESVSLERDIAILNAQISKAQLSIRARDITIAQLTDDIDGKNQTINKLSAKMDRERESLAQLLRKTQESDSYSLPEMVLRGETLSQFFADEDAFSTLNESIHASLAVVSGVKNDTEVEKATLEDKKQEENSLRAAQLLEKKRLGQAEADKKNILKLSHGKEQEYQKIIKDKEKSAASIRATLFSLSGSAAIPFGKALDYANIVNQKTGVRQALLLGIITEESNLGENVGTGNWKVDMKNPRDTVPFLDITSRLGLDPDKMPVSKKPWYGYGGAMGPAQFIPSTWVLFENRVSALTGHTPSNPWDPYDAFMASGLLLKDNGAARGTPDAERTAALCYLAGCTNAHKSAYAFYGDDVMALAAKYQGMINTLQGN